MLVFGVIQVYIRRVLDLIFFDFRLAVLVWITAVAAFEFKLRVLTSKKETVVVPSNTAIHRTTHRALALLVKLFILWLNLLHPACDLPMEQTSYNASEERTKDIDPHHFKTYSKLLKIPWVDQTIRFHCREWVLKYRIGQSNSWIKTRASVWHQQVKSKCIESSKCKWIHNDILPLSLINYLFVVVNHCLPR